MLEIVLERGIDENEVVKHFNMTQGWFLSRAFLLKDDDEIKEIVAVSNVNTFSVFPGRWMNNENFKFDLVFTNYDEITFISSSFIVRIKRDDDEITIYTEDLKSNKTQKFVFEDNEEAIEYLSKFVDEEFIAVAVNKDCLEEEGLLSV